MADANATNIVRVPITKGGKGAYVDVNIDEGGDVPLEVLREVYLQGLKVLLNRGMSKVLTKGLEGQKLEEAQAAAMKIAQDNLEKVRQGQIKLTGAAKTTKASGEIMTEARKIAKAMIKQGMKAKGIKVSHVEPKEITARANELLGDPEVGPEIVAQATEAIAERKKKEEGIKVKLEALASKVQVSAKRVAAAEEKAKKEKAGTSAKQAGKVALRAKPKAGQQPTAH